MSKILISIVMFFMFFDVAFAQESRSVMLPIKCENSSFVENVLKNFKEEQIFVGQDDMHGVPGMNVLLFLNNKTGTYSLLFVVPNTNLICVAGSGVKGKIVYNN